MQSLQCQALDCMHNLSGQCSANVIQVNSTRNETYCDTYTRSDTFVAKEYDNSKYNTFNDSTMDTEFGDEFVGSPKISCNVTKCAYNKSFHCRADDVNIDNPHDTMMCNCNTYRPK